MGRTGKPVAKEQGEPEEDLLEAFSLFDREGKGIITIEDLREASKVLNEPIDESLLRDMIEIAGAAPSKGVDFEEFCHVMK